MGILNRCDEHGPGYECTRCYQPKEVDPCYLDGDDEWQEVQEIRQKNLLAKKLIENIERDEIKKRKATLLTKESK